MSVPLNDASFTAREWPGRPVPAWPERSRLPQSFAEWFLDSMPFCMITYGHNEHVSAPARHFLHDHLVC